MPESRLLRTLVSPYVLGEPGRYDIEAVENMSEEEWLQAVTARLQTKFRIEQGGKPGEWLAKLFPLTEQPASPEKHVPYVGRGETFARAVMEAVLAIIQSPDRELLPHPHGISTIRRSIKMKKDR